MTGTPAGLDEMAALRLAGRSFSMEEASAERKIARPPVAFNAHLLARN